MIVLPSPYDKDVSPEEIVRRFIRSFRKQDYEEAVAFMHPGFVEQTAQEFKRAIAEGRISVFAHPFEEQEPLPSAEAVESMASQELYVSFLKSSVGVAARHARTMPVDVKSHVLGALYEKDMAYVVVRIEEEPRLQGQAPRLDTVALQRIENRWRVLPWGR